MHRILLVACLVLAGCLDETVDPETDTDADGYSDVQEQEAGSDPLDPESVPTRDDSSAPPSWPAWGELASATIRPGGSLGGYCTFNFLFEAPNGTAYIGTAAHCTDELGERLSLAGVGEIATVVYDSDLMDSGVDFTLALLDADKVANAHPQMWGWEGPTGNVTTAELAVGDQVQLHGYGLILGESDVTRDRWGVLVDWNEDEYNVDMPAVNGDSGSPLLHESGKAFGIISRYGTANTPPSTDQGPMMPYIFRELAKAGWGDVRLAIV